MRKLTILAFCVVLAAGAAIGAASAAEQTGPAKTTYKVAMKDGVRLATDVYLPEGDGPWPVLLTRLPYNKNGLKGIAGNFTKLGYAVVAQDVRGTFESEGKYDAFESDAWGQNRDGYETVEWVAAQPWCNGKIGTFGGSALGITQNLMAGACPPHLVCQFVDVASSDFYSQCAYIGGAFLEDMMVRWLKGRGAPEIVDRWLSHPTRDSFWSIFDCESRHPLITVPVYNVGGWYDIFAIGTMNSFIGLQTRGGPGARGNQKVVMGPWTHGINIQKAGELTYPKNAKNDQLDKDRTRWFDYWLKGDDNGIMREPPVNYYVMGDVDDPSAPGNVWRHVSGWPPANRITNLYLHSGNKLGYEKSSSDPETYQYDPDNPVPTRGGNNLFLPAGPMDQKKIGERADILKYETEPLEKPIEVTGTPCVRLYATSSAPDTDWVVKLIDVYPDGREMLVSDTALRARYRNSFTTPEFMNPGEVCLFNIEFWPTSIVFNKGHKIALHVTSSNYPRYSVNPNSEDGKTKQVAQNTIYHDRQHPSALMLPVAENSPQ